MRLNQTEKHFLPLWRLHLQNMVVECSNSFFSLLFLCENKKNSFGAKPGLLARWIRCFDRPNIEYFYLICESSHYYCGESLVFSGFFSLFLWLFSANKWFRIDRSTILWKRSFDNNQYFFEKTHDYLFWKLVLIHRNLELLWYCTVFLGHFFGPIDSTLI